MIKIISDFLFTKAQARAVTFIQSLPKWVSLQFSILMNSIYHNSFYSHILQPIPVLSLNTPNACLKVLLSFFLFFPFVNAQKIQSGKKFYKKFYHTNLHKIPQHFEFKQENEHYKNDSLYGNSVWYEEINYPKYFRIQFGMNNGNYVLFQNDSSYRYDFGVLKEKKYSPNRLLFMVGGFVFYPYKTSLEKINSFGIDLNVSYTTELNGKKVRVIGSKPNDFTKNQWWIDEKTLQVLRIIEEVSPQVMMRYDFKNFEFIDKKFYIENEVWVYQNEVLVQKEYYRDIKILKFVSED